MFARLLLFAAAALLAVPAGAARAAETRRPHALAYTVEHVAGPDAPRLRVELAFDGNASGTTSIALPSEWGGQSDLDAAVRDLAVVTPGATLADTGIRHVKTVRHAPGERVRVRYELAQDRERPLDPGRGAGYRVVVQPTFLHLLGHNAWVRPAWDDATPVRVSLAWKSLPKEWSIANSFGTGLREQTIETQLGAFMQAVFVAGDFRLTRADVRGKPVHVAVRGTWRFTDAEFAALVGKIFELERGFWNDFEVPYYLITLTQLDAPPPGGYSIGGTGLTDSFALFVTPNVELKDFRYLLAHELFHDWNSQKLGRMPEPEQSHYWVSEGFTDYYTFVLLARGGLLSSDEYLARYNEVLREYHLSPARDADNDRVVREFWSDQHVGRLPYWRGALLAMKWDAEIRAATSNQKSFDDAMRDLRDRARSTPGATLDARAVAEAVGRHLGRDVSQDVERYVVRGEAIAPELLGPCFEPATLEIREFELGLDLDAVKNKVVAKVVEGSAAHAAGLRDGMTIVRRKPIHLGDPTKEVEITVRDGDAERTITYLPAARTGRLVPQLRFRDAAGCAEGPLQRLTMFDNR